MTTPLCINRKEAAALVGLSPNAFESAVERGELPKPVKFGRRKVWYVKALEKSLDERTGIKSSSTERDKWLED